MTFFNSTVLLLWTTLLELLITTSYAQSFCSVFQPFKVTPENAKYQIGGPFPLHTDDCVHVRPDVIQELIAVQWALSHWNQNPNNANFKLAMSAADTCSREMESLSQTVTFLNEAGFFLPKECSNSENTRSRAPLGLIMPSIQSRKLKHLKELLSAVQMPMITYSTPTAQSLFDAQQLTSFSTAPTTDHYAKAATILLNQLKTNHVTLIYSDDHMIKSTLEKQITILAKSGVIVSELMSLDQVTGAKLTAQGSSDVILLMTTKTELLELISSTKIKIRSLQKLLIAVPIQGEWWSEAEIKEFLVRKDSPSRFLMLQQQTLFDSDQFRAYFLDILRNNYQTYALLATYMQQIYNCTLIGEQELTDCGQIDSFDLLDGFTYNRAIESAVLATYSFGVLAKAMASDPNEPCAKAGPPCTLAATSFLKDRLAYTFGESDPLAYRGFNLRFGEDRVLKGLKIEGVYARWDSEFSVDTIMNYSTDGEWQLQTDLVKWADGRGIVSWCQPWRQECQKQLCTSDRRYEMERMWLQKPGQLYIMGLFDIRNRDTAIGKCNNTVEDPRTLAMPAAFVYTLETVRQKYPDFNLLPEVELGGILIDACHDSIAAIEPIIAASTNKCLQVTETYDKNATILASNVAGFATGQKDAEYDTIRLLFSEKGGVRKPLIASSGLEKISPFTISTNLMPDYNSQARVLLDLLVKQNWDYVSVLLSEHDAECIHAYEAFRHLVEADDRVCISDVVRAGNGQKLESIRSRGSPASKVAIAFTTAQDTTLLLKTASIYGNGRQDDRPMYIFVGDAHDWALADEGQMRLVSKLSAAAWGAVSVQPRRKVPDDFRSFLATINPKRLPERWFIKFWEDYFQCAVGPDSLSTLKKPCIGSEHMPTETFGRMTREAYFMTGLETLIFTLDSIYKQACPEQKGLCEAFFHNEHYGKLAELMSRTSKSDQQFMIYNYRSIKSVAAGAAYVEIGNWSTSDGLRLNETWTWYDLDGNANGTLPESSCRPPLCRCKLDNDFFKKPIEAAAASMNGDGDQHIGADDRSSHRSLPNGVRSPNRKSQSGLDFSAFTASRSQWKSQPWAYIFVVVNTLLLLVAVVVLGLVCLKLCYRVVKGNQSLGICLLCGVIMMYISAYFFIFDPCELLCRLRYIFHSLAYTVCFGAMIAKAVQLRNSESLGFNGYVSYWNYWMLLFFIVTVQLALNMQWAIIRDPVVISFLVEGDASTPTIILHCSWSSEEFLASQIYVVILLSMTLFLSLMNRNVKRNYKETRWLMYTSLICAPIWIIWMISYALVPEPFKDTVVVMELITCATVILCFMFGPKLYILLSYEPVLIEYPPGFKLDLGNGGGSLEKHSIEVPTMYGANTDLGCLNFGDGDDSNEDGQRSVISSSSASTKSTSLSHTLSSASTLTTKSDGSLTPVYHAVVRKKSRSKKVRADPPQDAVAVGSVSPEVAERRDMIFGETISSVH